MFDKDKYIDLICEAPNWISSNKIYVLPHLTGHLGVVELIILGGTVVVESTHHPIRHGRHCASRVHLGSCYGKIDLNPKFFWNGKEWLLNTFGTAVFAEIEINQPPKVCVCNQ
jgi:hypothetical protein